LLFLLALRDHTIISKNYATGHLSVGLIPRLLHSRQFQVSEKTKEFEKTDPNTHQYLANEFSEGSIATASANLIFDSKQADPIY
jgi:hypothetical protein